MSVQKDGNIIPLGNLDDLFDFSEEGVVVLSSFGLDSLPGHVQAHEVQSPVFEIDEVLLGKRVVLVEMAVDGNEGEDFFDGVDAVVESNTAVLVLDRKSVV